MALEVTTNVSLSGTLDCTSGDFDLSRPFNRPTLPSMVANLIAGTGDGRANLLWHDSITVATSPGTSLDLQNLGLGFFNAAGGGGAPTVSFAEIKLAIFYHYSGDDDVYVIGDGIGPPFAPWNANTAGDICIPVGGWVALANPSGSGFTVDASTKAIKLERPGSGSSAVVYVYFVGIST